MKLLTVVLISWLMLPVAHAVAESKLQDSGNDTSIVTDLAPSQVDDKKVAVPGEANPLSDTGGGVVEDLAKAPLDHSGLSERDRKNIERMVDTLKNAETLADLGRLAEGGRSGETDGDNYRKSEYVNDPAIVSAVIPVVAIVFVFGAPVVIVALVMWVNMKKARLQHETVAKLIESGQEIPPDFFERLSPRPKPNINLNRGIILCATGLGLGLASVLNSSAAFGAIGLVLLFIGAALLLIWRLESRAQGSVR